MTNPARGSPPAVDDRLFRCWRDGLSPRAAVTSIRKYTGARLSFEDVRQAYVDLCERFA